MASIGLKDTVRREIARMTSRKMYAFILFFVPIFCTVFFTTLLDKGLPLESPVAVVDMDHSALSRQVTRSLGSIQYLDVTEYDESFNEAMDKVRGGEIFGFFVIPANFESDALGGRKPTLEFYSNMTYFVPGTFVFKGFKTIAVGTAAGTVKTVMSSVGLDPQQISSAIQPVSFDQHLIGNPWMNYSYYLSPSFIFGVLALMILMGTVYAITTEIKMGTSPGWISTARGHISVALVGKLLPYTVCFSLTGWFILAWMFGFRDFPCNGSILTLVCTIPLFVLANQAFATFICCIVPNPRLALSVVALIGILTFSIAGFSFPVENMYGFIAILSYIIPVRYLFEIYVNDVVLGAPVFYSRMMFIGLILFLLLPPILSRRLKKACLNPVYVP